MTLYLPGDISLPKKEQEVYMLRKTVAQEDPRVSKLVPDTKWSGVSSSE